MFSVGERIFAKDLENLPYTTLGYQNGSGLRSGGTATYPDLAYMSPAASGRQDLSKVDTPHSGFHQESLVSLYAETHSGEDVVVYASAPELTSQLVQWDKV